LKFIPVNSCRYFQGFFAKEKSGGWGNLSATWASNQYMNISNKVNNDSPPLLIHSNLMANNEEISGNGTTDRAKLNDKQTISILATIISNLDTYLKSK
jgi:hypothetical protein